MEHEVTPRMTYPAPVTDSGASWTAERVEEYYRIGGWFELDKTQFVDQEARDVARVLGFLQSHG